MGRRKLFSREVAYEAIAEGRSFRRVAEELGVPRQALQKAIKPMLASRGISRITKYHPFAHRHGEINS